jgi:hypothetical protein
MENIKHGVQPFTGIVHLAVPMGRNLTENCARTSNANEWLSETTAPVTCKKCVATEARIAARSAR